MDNFNKRFIRLKEEIRALKTAHIKSSTSIKTVSKSIDVSIPMVGAGGGFSAPAKYAVITVTPTKDQVMLANMTMRGQDFSDGRIYSIHRNATQGAVEPFDQRFFFTVSRGNAADAGNTLTFTLDVVTTLDFELSVTYYDYGGI